MRVFFKPVFFLLVFLAVVGVSLVVSSEVVSEEQDPLGNVNLPEGADIVSLPENVITEATLPNNELRITNQELDANASIGTQNFVPLQGGLILDRATDNASSKKIIIHLKTQTMDMVENGEVLNTFKISSGRRGMETPTGSFSILSKTPRAYSKTYGLYMPYWMAFTTRGHGIHELPEWPGGLKEGENHLGTPISHGCVRLGVGPAKILYEWAEIKTPVEVIL